MTDHPAPAGNLFDKPARPHPGIRVLVTGQVGLDKARFLDRVVAIARANGHEVAVFNVGERMYAEAPDIVPGRILDLPRQRLTALRRSVFKDILTEARTGKNLIVNTHATFRWKHGLFHAYDHNQITQLAPNLYVTLVDNVDAVHERLDRDHEVRHSLKDILVWREEEIVVTEAMAEAVSVRPAAHRNFLASSIVTVNGPWRICFEFRRGDAYDVEIVNYHKG